jgi:hypothetical protein
MAIPSSGPISLQTIQDEFGGSHPISLSEYYGSDTVPTSGAISISNFYGTSSVTPVTVTIASNTNNYTLQPSAVPGYVSGGTAVTFIINSGVVIGSTSTGSTALTISGFASGDTVTVTNNGYIVGKGGNGGNGQGSGYAGGTAISASFDFNIANNGTVGGGGGGGSGGNTYSYDCSSHPATPATCYVRGGGGGGGAGYGAGGSPSSSGSGYGSGGSLTSGGSGASYNGASGGSLGSSGGSSNNSGGAGGKYINGASYANWTTIGTRLGTAT